MTLKHIYRVEGNGHGWQVHIKRPRRQFARYFPDGADSPFHSLATAIRWRDDTWRVAGPARHARSTPTSRHASGVVGVSRETYKTTTGATAERYRATWRDASDITRRQSFSIDKYGEQPAKQMAIAARAKGAAEAAKARQARLLDVLHAHSQLSNKGAAEA